jgi:branched-chain amino acid transport system substrate-binding protein
MVKKRAAIAAALVAALAVTAAGVAGGVSRAAPVADVKIGLLCDLSGPTSDIGVGYCRGEVDYMAYFNSKGGFANKAKVDVTAQDFAYNVARALQLYSQQSSGPVAFLGWGTADTSALSARITADKLPYFSASYAEQLTDPKDTPYNFVVGTNYTPRRRSRSSTSPSSRRGTTRSRSSTTTARSGQPRSRARSPTSSRRTSTSAGSRTR